MKSLLLCILPFFGAAVHAAPAQVLIIRHAEKPENGPVLSPEGQKHADEFARYFTSCSDVLQYGPPVAIYAMYPSRDEGSIRAIQTVAPLAEKLGVHPVLAYTKKQYAAMVEEIMNNRAASDKTVLICWEHKVIRDIVAALGVTEDPGRWDREDYNTVYRIEFNKDGSVKSFTRLKDKVPAEPAL